MKLDILFLNVAITKEKITRTVLFGGGISKIKHIVSKNQIWFNGYNLLLSQFDFVAQCAAYKCAFLYVRQNDDNPLMLFAQNFCNKCLSSYSSKILKI